MNQNWVRSDLKYRAKDAIRKNYWPAVLVSLILTIITYVCGNGNAGSGTRSVITQYRYQSGGSYYWGSVTDKIYGIGEYVLHSPLGILLAIVSTGLMLSLLAIGIALRVFVGNVLEVGSCRFYVENLYSNPGVKKVLYGFNSGAYLNIVKTMFFRDLYVCLWSLLFVIPGIIKSYEYRMVPYLLAEYPDMSRQEAFARSKEMMYGQKWRAFVLDLSFLGWNILSGITFGIVGLFYGRPYQDSTDAELYDVLASTPTANNYYYG